MAFQVHLSALRENKLSELSFDEELSEFQIEELADALADVKTLTTLDLSHQNIDPIRAWHLSEGLKLNSSLNRLTLSSKMFGSAGSKHIADALKENSSLTALSLTGTKSDLGEVGIRHFNDALDVNEKLRELYISKHENLMESRKVLNANKAQCEKEENGSVVNESSIHMSTEGYSEHTVMGVKVLQSIRQGIASQLWPAAEVLASFTLQVFCPQDENHASTSSDLGVKKVRVMTKEIRESRETVRILELGAGVGLTGIKCAKAIPNSSVILTDLEQAMGLLRKNIEVNNARNAVAQPLDWGADTDTKRIKQVDLILAADCVYWEELHDPFKKTILDILSRNPTSVALICGMRRWKSDNAFYRSLNKVKGNGGKLKCELVFERVDRKSETCNEGFNVEDESNLLAQSKAERSVMRIYAVRYISSK